MSLEQYNRRVIATLAIALTLLAIGADAAVEYPKATAWVNDYAEVLSSGDKQQLDTLLQNFETTDSTQVFVAIIKRLPNGMSVEEYASELFAAWKIGQEKKDNGVLLLIAIESRQLRIEVGYGLEDRLTDAQSKLIMLNAIAPSFKENRYGEGVTNGVYAIIAACRGAYTGEEKPLSWGETIGGILLVIFAIIVAIVVVIFFINLIANVAEQSEWSSRPSSHEHKSSHRHSSWSSGSSSNSRSNSSRSSGFSGGGGGCSGGGGASGSW